MSGWGTSSRVIGWAALGSLGAALLLSGPPVGAKVFLSQREALDLAFPTADRIDDKVYIITSKQKAAIQKKARAELESELVTVYSAIEDDRVTGYAFIDIHTVRTHPEAFMAVLNPDGTVRSLHVLAFYEPTEYMPTDRWYRQFTGKSLANQLRVGRDVHNVVGATLSTYAVSRSVRRILAMFEVLVEKPDEEPDSK